MDMQHDHMNRQIHLMREEVHALAAKYDAKILAILLMERAVALFRALQVFGAMDADEVNRTIVEAIKMVHDPLPLDQIPEQRIIGKPGKLS